MSTRHLTLTGFYAGTPLCGNKREGDTGAHAVWLSVPQMAEYRQSDDRCEACLSVWDEEVNDADEEPRRWV